MYYIERAKPKPPKEPSHIGRPPLSAEHKEARKLGRSLQDIYLKLKTLHDEQSWERLFGAQFAQLETMVQDADIDGLRTMFKEQPWTKKRKLKEPEI